MMNAIFKLLITHTFLMTLVSAEHYKYGSTRRTDHPRKHRLQINKAEKHSQYWYKDARDIIASKRHMELNKNIAKNIILFMGDGMSTTTIKAARVYMGQQEGKDGERAKLAMEEFPFTGIVKTYCLNAMVADSACASTALLRGIKANYGTVGVNGFVQRHECNESKKIANKIDSIATWAQSAGKRTGFVTTATVTDASPAGVYAYTADRYWEKDADMVSEQTCDDSAYQLIHSKTGKRLNVIMGGGRQNFVPNTVQVGPNVYGGRLDHRNLIEDWLEYKKNKRAAYVFNKTGLHKAVQERDDYILGLFADHHMKFALDDHNRSPTLEEMTEAAVKTLSKGKQGYFLFVEGGLIDKAHHKNLAHKALSETVEFSKAIKIAMKMTNPHDTLIVVTSDHSHGLGMAGPSARGDNILGFAKSTSDSRQRYTILSYTTGPGGQNSHNLELRSLDVNLQYPALVSKNLGGHSGEDVPVFAFGPWAHLFTGVMEQHILPHIMAFASCIGEGEIACKKKKKKKKP